MNSPAFQFYAADYLASSKVQRMSLEEEGAYVRLLAYNWTDDSIPSDIGKLARMCKTTRRKMQAMWDGILHECFGPLPGNPDRLTSPRLEHERQKQAEFRLRKIEAGKNGGLESGRSRREAKRSTALNLLEADAKQNEPLQSPSPSSKEETPKPPSGEYSPEFETFWQSSSRRGSKADAFKEWQKLKPSSGLRDEIKNAIADACKSPEWLKEHGKYIPHVCRWLKSRGWEREDLRPAKPTNTPPELVY